MSDTFGPNTPQVEALIASIATLTQDEVAALNAARTAAWNAAWGVAMDAAWDAARTAARGVAWEVAWGVAWTAARDAARTAARDAAWDAVAALVVRDLITKEHFDALTGPWVSVIGPTWDEVVDEEDEACGCEVCTDYAEIEHLKAEVKRLAELSDQEGMGEVSD